MKRQLASGFAMLTVGIALGQAPAIPPFGQHPSDAWTVQNGDTLLYRDLTSVLGWATLNMDSADHGHGESYALWADYLSQPHPNVGAMRAYFFNAAAEFNVPSELLMAVAYVENNWTHIGPSIDQGWGVMHLVHNGYSQTLDEASGLLGLGTEVLKEDVIANIRGAAALLRFHADAQEIDETSLTGWVGPLKELTGLADDFLRTIQVREYYDVLQQGRTSFNLWGEGMAIDAVPGLAPLDSFIPFVVDGDRSSADYGPAITNLVPSCNYGSGRSTAIDTWVNHWVGTGTYAGAISWFQTCPGSGPGQRGYIPGTSTLYGPSSAHFVIRASDGQITQCVAVSNTAWHCGASGYPLNNPRSIGVEHEATLANPALWNSVPMLTASTTMACYFTDLYGIPQVQALPGIRGHGDMPGTSTSCPGSLPWATWMNMLNSCGTIQPPLCDNDEPCNPMSLSINSSCVNTSCSTIDATGPDVSSLTCNGTPYILNRADDDVWFSVTPTNTNPLTITVDPTSGNLDPVITVYTGNCNSPTPLVNGCSDDGPNNATEALVFTPVSGTTYLIQVYGYDDGSDYGNFQICVQGSGGASLPDLDITTATYSPSAVLPGGSLDTDYTIVNLNPGVDVTESTATGFYLVPFSQGCPTSPPPGSPFDVSSLSISEMSDDTEDEAPSIDIPIGTTPGLYYLVLVADWEEEQDESIETTNNVYCVPNLLTICEPIDLIPDFVSITVNPVCAGSTTSIEYTITNNGCVEAELVDHRRWRSDDDELDGGDLNYGSGTNGTIQAGETVDWTSNFTVPSSTPPGFIYFIVELDWSDEFDEGTAGEANNVLVVPVQVLAAPTVNTGSYGPLCSTGGSVALLGSPSGGTWTGVGVSGSGPYFFNPAAGTQTLTYTASSGGCSNSAQTTVVVDVCDCNGVPGGIAVPGTACNDGNANTGNDVYQANCICAGQLIDCLGVPGGTATIGSACDDGNANTGNDVYGANCVCAGQLVDCLGVPGGTATIGSACDDGNANTGNDVYQPNCTCAGQLIDCLGVPGGTATIGSACDDGNANTGNDVYGANCVCAGQLVDCLGVPGGTATIGSACDDGNTNTGNDVYGANCVCTGQLIDCLGAPGGPAQPGTSCDDADPCTNNDTWSSGCVCEGDPLTVPGSPVGITGPASAGTGTIHSFTTNLVTDATSYLWNTIPADWNGSSTSTSIDYTVGTVPAQVCVRALNVDCPGDSICVWVYDIGTGLPPVSVGSDWFTISPNPSTGTFQVTLAGPVASAIDIRVFDGLGQLVGTPVILTGSQPQPLDLHEKANGIYFLRATRGNECRVLDLVIQR